MEKVFKKGDKVICNDASGIHALKRGKTYIVSRYEESFEEPHFTWPAYVHVELEDGREATCHTSRFDLVTE